MLAPGTDSMSQGKSHGPHTRNICVPLYFCCAWCKCQSTMCEMLFIDIHTSSGSSHSSFFWYWSLFPSTCNPGYALLKSDAVVMSGARFLPNLGNHFLLYLMNEDTTSHLFSGGIGALDWQYRLLSTLLSTLWTKTAKNVMCGQILQIILFRLKLGITAAPAVLAQHWNFNCRKDFFV